jgi:hypothetical protein
LDATQCANNNDGAIDLLLKHNLSNDGCDSFITQSNSYSIISAQSTIFAGAERAPDMVAMSYIGYGDLETYGKDTAAPTLFSELFLINTGNDNNEEICRIAHHRTFGKRAQNTSSYEASLGEPIVTLSPSGTRVLYSSDWYDSGSVDTYVVELPSFTRLIIDGDWEDTLASNQVTRFAQAGAKFAFTRAETNNKDTNTQVTTGTGRIRGKQINLEYVTTVANQQVPGKCVATVQRDIDNLIFTCDDEHFGSNKLAITRQ